MDLPYAFVDSIAKMIPQELNITIDKALKMNPELRKSYESDEQVKYLIDMSRRLEGLPRHSSMHAAGVVISQKSVDEYVPLSRASDGSITTQFTMTTLEELGLLKNGFPRTPYADRDPECREKWQKKRMPDLDIDKIDYNDQDVLDYIGTGKTDRDLPDRERGDEKLYERAEATQSGRHHRRDLPVPSGTEWILFRSISKGKK